MTQPPPEVPYYGPPSYGPPSYGPPSPEALGEDASQYQAPHQPSPYPSPYTSPEYGTPYGAPADQQYPYGYPASPPAYGSAPYSTAPPTPYGTPAFPGSPDAQPIYPGYPSYPGYPDYAASAAPIRRRRSKIWILAAVLAVILVLGGIGFAVSSSSSSSSTASVVVPDGPGVAFTYPEGHFAARFPEHPDTQTLPESVGSVKINIRVAADRESETIVEEAGFSAPLPGSEQSAFLRSILSGFGDSSDETDTTFQGHTARQGSFTAATGDHLSALVVIYSNTRIYVLLAETGTAFTDLMASFVAIP